MRTLLVLASLISLTACDPAPETGTEGPTEATAAAGGGGGGTVNAAGGQQTDVDGTVADGAETMENMPSVGACDGEEVAIPTAEGDLGLTEGNALSLLDGQWERTLTPYQVECLETLQMARDGQTAEIEAMEESDLRQWALVVANAQAQGRGSSQEVSEANETFDSLSNLPEMNMNISGSDLEMTGDDPKTGTLSITAVDGNKVTVTLAPSAGGSGETVDIHFVSSSMIFVTQGAGSTTGSAFRKIN